MSNFGIFSTALPVITRVVQSADPVDLATRLNAALAELATVTVEIAPDVFIPVSIADVELAGGGDGHTFVATITASPVITDGPGGIAPSDMRATCYLASEAEALQLARAAAFASIVTPPLIVYDELVAGASKGTRFMGLLLTSAPGDLNINLLQTSTLYSYAFSAPPGAAVPIAVQSTPVIVPGPYVLTDPSAMFTVVAPGHLRYTGTKAFLAQVRVRVTARFAGAPATSGIMRVGVMGPSSPPVSFMQSQTGTAFEVGFVQLNAEVPNVSFTPQATPAEIAVGIANETDTTDFEVLSVELTIQPVR